MGGMMTSGLCANDEIPLLDQDNGTELDSTTDDIRVKPATVPGVKRTPIYVFVLAFLSAIGGFLFGYDTGVVAGASLPIADKFKFTTFEKEVFVSITIGAAAVFAIVGGILNDKIGRKPSTLLASCVFTVGAIVLAAAESKAALLIGRFILGIGIGLTSMTVPIYIAECAPPHYRGQLVSLNQAFISGGMFISLLVSGAFCPVTAGWRYMLGLAAVPAILQFIGFLFMPESPRWLVDQGKDQLAKQILRRLRGVTDVSAEYQAIKDACDEETRAREMLGARQGCCDYMTVVIKVFTTPPVRRALIIGCTLQLFQQITGINTIMYYSASIIHMAGVKDACKAIWYASITAFVNFIFTFVGIALVERVGRRVLFLSSLAGVTLSLVFTGVAFQVEDANTPNATILSPVGFTDPCTSQISCGACVEDPNCGFCYDIASAGQIVNSTCLSHGADITLSLHGACSHNTSEAMVKDSTWAYNFCPSPYSWMAILGMVIYLASFSPGMGPMPWTINSEIYPLWARSFCNSLATFINWIFNLLISITFLSLSESITKQGAFYLYASFGVVGFAFFFLFLPETSGRSLEEMNELFSGSWFVRSKNKYRQT